MPFDGNPGTVGRVAKRSLKPSAAREKPRLRDDDLEPNLQLVDGLRSLQLLCVNAGAPISVAVTVDALYHAAQREGHTDLKPVEKAARAYLRRHGAAPVVPRRHELIRILESIAAQCVAMKSDADTATRRLIFQLGFSAPRVFRHPAKQAPSSAALFKSTLAEVKNAVDTGADSEGLVVAALVGWGLSRQTARRYVQDAFRRND